MICSVCRKDHSESTKMCPSCKERARQYSKNGRKKAKSEGKCITCRTVAARPGFSTCSNCSSVSVQWKQNHPARKNCNMSRGLYGYCPHEHQLRLVSGDSR